MRIELDVRDINFPVLHLSPDDHRIHVSQIAERISLCGQGNQRNVAAFDNIKYIYDILIFPEKGQDHLSNRRNIDLAALNLQA